jgi:hypothetical protein
VCARKHKIKEREVTYLLNLPMWQYKEKVRSVVLSYRHFATCNLLADVAPDCHAVSCLGMVERRASPPRKLGAIF